MSLAVKNRILKGLREVEGFHDVIFKWVGDGRTVEMKKHKIVLCASSPTFLTQFLGEMAHQQGNAEAGNIETVLLKDFNPEAYNLCFDLMYGELEVLETVKDPRLLFQLFGLVQKYMVAEEIVDLISQRLVALDVTKDNIVSALETFVEFKDLEGFQDATKCLLNKAVKALTIESVLPALQTVVQIKGEEELKTKILTKIVQTVMAKFPDNNPTKFYLEHIDDHFVEMKALMKAIAVYTPASDKCKPINRCKDEEEFKTERVKPVVGLRVSGDSVVGTVWLVQ